MLEPLGFVKNLVETVRSIMAAGVGAIVATSVNGLGISSGTDVSGTPASIAFTRLGTIYFGVGNGAVTSWSAPSAGSLYVNSATGGLYWKYGASATNWVPVFQQGSALSATTAVLSSFLQLTGSFLQLAEIATPATGGTDQGRLYLDNGGAGGKSRLMIIFQTGAAVVVALEP